MKETALKPILTIQKTASFLGISTATVRNWVKCGHLRTNDQGGAFTFHISEIQNIKNSIENGELQKLNGRANKSKTDRTFVPEEYLDNVNDAESIEQIINFVDENKVNTFVAVLLLSINLLQKLNLISLATVEALQKKQKLSFSHRQLQAEIESWITEINTNDLKSNYSFLLECDLPEQQDILGLIYQSLLLEGKKSQTGSYYTPKNIVDNIVKEYIKTDSKVLDPCCGTGQFLLAFADIVDDPKNVYGIDIDPMAVRIARINLLVKYKDKDFAPNIVCKNTLFEIGNYDLFSLNDENIRDFDVIATNPPWGVHFSKKDIERLKTMYPNITSFESFSYFLKKSIDLLKTDGIISLVLPESILNVKTHKDIREIILKNTTIKKVAYLDRIFKNVFTPVITIDLQKSTSKKQKIEIVKGEDSYPVEQSRWLQNQDFIFDIHVNASDNAIIDKMYSLPHKNLLGHADWALGVVTGNNKEYVVSEQNEGHEPIYKGKDINCMVLGEAKNYIKFTPEKFQQVAPVQKYRAKEKLIYRFISKKLVFAYDDKQSLTLNSANIVIPNIENYPIKVIAALFNSSPYQFLFQKKFSSIKVLKSHIEQLPLPEWGIEILDEISKHADQVIENQIGFEKLDDYITNQFGFTAEEKESIYQSVK